MRNNHQKPEIKTDLPPAPEGTAVNAITAGKLLQEALQADSAGVGVSMIHAICKKCPDFRAETMTFSEPYGPDEVIAVATVEYQNVPLGMALWSAGEIDSTEEEGDFFIR